MKHPALNLPIMSPNPNIPYNALPDLPPAADVETKEILKLCLKARVALEGLNRTAQLTAKDAILLRIFPLLEAQASSAVENIAAPTDTLFKYAGMPKKADPAARDALRCKSALLAGLRSLEDGSVSLRTAEAVCSVLRGTPAEVRSAPGTYMRSSLTGGAVYTPPAGAQVIRDKMAAWEKFLSSDCGLDLLVVMALSHYQFEAIHPFCDGNGRTGRILNLLLLVQNGLLNLPVLCLSRYILRHRADYYAALNRVTAAGDWDGWIKYMLQAVSDASDWTREKVLGIRRMEKETSDRLRGVPELKKIYSEELADVLLSFPYVRIQTLTEKGIARRQAASKYLHMLASYGMLTALPSAKEKLFVNRPLMDFLKSE
jgi:Fic family protein